jgi:tryptophan synthase beta chain
VKLIGVEAGGLGLNTDKNGATLEKGRPGILHGCYSFVLQDENGQISESYSVSAGLDYPGVGPQHAYLYTSGRAQYVSVTDQEALDAFRQLSQDEGIIPALESAHAVAYAKKLAESAKEPMLLLVNLSGRGDKDMEMVRNLIKL